ncbi:MAG: 5-formyltetrahydrofolate cyclo-ligase [Planctomycetota bacterium]|jgi:5-formyltetrahydrofolate cyclo-ligase
MASLAKRKLRNSVLEARDALSEAERASKSEAIQNRLFALPQWPPDGPVLFFHTMKTEVNTVPMMKVALDASIPVSLPRMAEGGALELLMVTDLDEDLEPNAIGIREPRPGAPRVNPRDLRIVIVPGVAFDPLGYRIGYGGGYYDRLLASAPRPLRVGLAFDLQRVPSLPRQPHDVPVDVLVTESGVHIHHRR